MYTNPCLIHFAKVVELADSLDSGSSVRKGVRVQIPPFAPIALYNNNYCRALFILCYLTTIATTFPPSFNGLSKYKDTLPLSNPFFSSLGVIAFQLKSLVSL